MGTFDKKIYNVLINDQLEELIENMEKVFNPSLKKNKISANTFRNYDNLLSHILS